MNESNKNQIVPAILAGIIYGAVKTFMFFIAYVLFTTDFGIDVHMNAFKAFGIAYAFMIAIFYSLLGH